MTALADGLRTGEIPDAPDGTGVSSWTGATTTAVIGGAALVLLAAHQLSRRSGTRRVPTRTLTRRARHGDSALAIAAVVASADRHWPRTGEAVTAEDGWCRVAHVASTSAAGAS